MTRKSTLSQAEQSIYYESMPELAPARVVEIELGQPLPILEAFSEKEEQHYQRAICVVRLHTRPLGIVRIPFVEGSLKPEQYARHIWTMLHSKIVEHLRQDDLPTPIGLEASGLPCAGIPRCIEDRERFYAEAPFVSVIVSTHDRPERIQKCVQSLLALHYPRYEIIVVDNAPSTGATADIIQQTYGNVPQIHYVREDRRGLSSARNCGLRKASGEILAFADDDLVIDPFWLIELVRGFSAADDVVCVTGLILPLELDTPSQFWFEEFGGVSKGFVQRIFERNGNSSRWSSLHPYTAGQFGSGASIAFTKSFLQQVGGFDPALGTGSLARAGEDLAIFFQAVIGGHRIVYEPASFVYHPHYREYKDLRKQIYGYGMGLGAYVMKIVWDKPYRLFEIALKVPYGLFFLLSAKSPKNSKKLASFPKELTTIERKGVLYGPFAYIKSRREYAKKEMDRRMLLDKQTSPDNAVQFEDFMPIRIVEIELGRSLPIVQALDATTGQFYQCARCLIRLHNQPLGLIELQLGEWGVSPREYAPQIWHMLEEKINEHLVSDFLPPLTQLTEDGILSPSTPRCIEMREQFLESAPFVSIIVATHERPLQLMKCIHSLLALHYPQYEIIVVDNAPSTTVTAKLVQEIGLHNPHVHYEREDIPGLSWARNRGVLLAQGDILVFTDDDVVVDRYWLVELVRAFNATTDAVCVTGLILPLELETQTQLWFEEKTFPSRVHYDGFCPGFVRRFFDMKTPNASMPLHPYMAGRFGAGANMAFTKSFLQSISGFDPALGVGSLTQGGEDHAAFFQVITQGYKLVYEPTALVYHCHRRDYESLYKQMYGYGTGFTAYLMRCLLIDPKLIVDFAAKLPRALFFMLSKTSIQQSVELIHYPKELRRVEMRGRLIGPLTYIQSLWRLRRMRNSKQ